MKARDAWGLAFALAGALLLAEAWRLLAPPPPCPPQAMCEGDPSAGAGWRLLAAAFLLGLAGGLVATRWRAPALFGGALCGIGLVPLALALRLRLPLERASALVLALAPLLVGGALLGWGRRASLKDPTRLGPPR